MGWLCGLRVLTFGVVRVGVTSGVSSEILVVRVGFVCRSTDKDKLIRLFVRCVGCMVCWLLECFM